MTRDELLARLVEVAQDDDCEYAHIRADDALIDFINDGEISEAYRKVCKWYS